MLTYRTFVSPRELLNLIELRWDCKPPPGEDPEQFRQNRIHSIRLRIYNMAKIWLEKFYYDFTSEDGPQLLEAFEAFIKKMERTGLPNAANHLLRILQKKVRNVVCLTIRFI